MLNLRQPASHSPVMAPLQSGATTANGACDWPTPSKRRTCAWASNKAEPCSGHSSLSFQTTPALWSICERTGFGDVVSESCRRGGDEGASERSEAWTWPCGSSANTALPARSRSIQRAIGIYSNSRAFGGKIPLVVTVLLALTPLQSEAQTLSLPEFARLARTCAPNVAVSALMSIARTERNSDRLTIHGNTAKLAGAPRRPILQAYRLGLALRQKV